MRDPQARRGTTRTANTVGIKRSRGAKKLLSFLTSRKFFYLIGIFAMVASTIVFVLPNTTPGTSANRTTSERTPISTPLPTGEATETTKNESTAPAMAIDPEKSYFATVKTEKGEVRLELDAKTSPHTVNNFVSLAKSGFYNGLTFYRVIPGSYVQAGDRVGDGSGGPGYAIDGDPGGLKLSTASGTVAMVDIGPRSYGSQFAIMLSSQPSFDGKYNVFGRVIEGIDVLSKLTARDPSAKPDYQGDKIVSISIEEK